MFEELVEAVEKLPKRERPESAWVRPGTWALIDERAARRKEGNLTQREARRLGRKIAAALKEDRKERARKAGEAIMMELKDGNVKEAWRILKGWFREAGGTTVKRCYASMEHQTVEREALYDFQAPPGEHIPRNREPVHLPDEAPSDAEIRAAVKNLKNGRTGGGTMMRAEDLKGWLRRMEAEEKAQKEGAEGLEQEGGWGARPRWDGDAAHRRR